MSNATPEENVSIIWAALDQLRDRIEEAGEPWDERWWDDICTAMADIQEDLNCEEKVDP